MPVIGVDWIGTVVNHLPIKLRVVQEFCPELGVTTIEEMRRERLEHRISTEEYRKVGEEVGRRMHDYPLHAGALEAMRQIIACRVEIVVVTFTTQATNGDFWAFIRRHSLPIRAVEIVPHDREKIARSKKWCIKTFLDDNESVLEALKPLGVPLYLADFAGEARNWNPGIIRVASWADFADAIERKAPAWEQ